MEFLRIFLLPITTAFIGTLLAIGPLAALAKRIGIVDRSGSDPLKIHRGDIPLSGGPSILAGMILGLLVASSMRGGHEALYAVVPIAAIAPFAAGLLDDARARTPIFRLAAQASAGFLLFIWGVKADMAPIWYLALPLTIFYTVGGANALNLLDGLDGLAGGVSAVSSASLLVLAFIKGDLAAAKLFACAGGSVLAFLLFNRPPARVFLGNSGAYLIGTVLAAGMVRLMEPFGIAWFLGPLMCFAVPLADTSWAITRRIMHRSSLLSGDRNHLYDTLRNKGWPILKVLALFYILAAVGGFIGFAFVSY